MILTIHYNGIESFNIEISEDKSILDLKKDLSIKLNISLSDLKISYSHKILTNQMLIKNIKFNDSKDIILINQSIIKNSKPKIIEKNEIPLNKPLPETIKPNPKKLNSGIPDIFTQMFNSFNNNSNFKKPEITDDQILEIFGKKKNSQIDLLLKNPKIQDGLSLIRVGLELYGIDKYKNYLQSPQKPSSPYQLYASQLQQLHSLGYYDDELNIKALIQTNGDITQTIQILVNNSH